MSPRELSRELTDTEFVQCVQPSLMHVMASLNRLSDGNEPTSRMIALPFYSFPDTHSYELPRVISLGEMIQISNDVPLKAIGALSLRAHGVRHEDAVRFSNTSYIHPDLSFPSYNSLVKLISISRASIETISPEGVEIVQALERAAKINEALYKTRRMEILGIKFERKARNTIRPATATLVGSFLNAQSFRDLASAIAESEKITVSRASHRIWHAVHTVRDHPDTTDAVRESLEEAIERHKKETRQAVTQKSIDHANNQALTKWQQDVLNDYVAGTSTTLLARKYKCNVSVIIRLRDRTIARYADPSNINRPEFYDALVAEAQRRQRGW
jgi:hypothetical protein